MNEFVISCPYEIRYISTGERSAFLLAKSMSKTFRCPAMIEDIARSELFKLTWRGHKKRPLLNKLRYEELGEWRATRKENPVIACANGHPYEAKNIYTDRRSGKKKCYTCMYEAVPRLKGVM